jgi:thioesterase domain-containing protein
MTAADVEVYLHRHIPLSAAMGVRVTDCTAAGVTLAAPLEPNVNHRATVFGGSLSAVAILAAWSWLHFTLRGAGESARLVIQSNRIDYLAPVAGEFTARCEGVSPERLKVFLATYRRHGRARLEVAARLDYRGAAAANFAGDYVAVRLPPDADVTAG